MPQFDEQRRWRDESGDCPQGEEEEEESILRNCMPVPTPVVCGSRVEAFHCVRKERRSDVCMA